MTALRGMGVFGHPGDHAELVFDDVRVPKENLVGGLNQGWKLITEDSKTTPVSKGLVIERPTDPERYLGCLHKLRHCTMPDGTKAKGIEYDMEEFMRSTVTVFHELAAELKVTQYVKLDVKAQTPFVQVLVERFWR